MKRWITALAWALVLASTAPAGAQEEPDQDPSVAEEQQGTADEPNEAAPTDETDATEVETETGTEIETETDDQSDAPEPSEEAASPVLAGGVSDTLLAEENSARIVTNRYGMLALGAWALGNFGWATVGLLTQDEDPARAFHLTNAAWNLVNGTIAVFGYFGSISESREELDLVDTLAADHTAEKVFLANGALDVAYIFGGAFLATKGTLDDKQALVGTGRSVMLQGAFLLAFDATLWAIHWMRRRKFQKSIGR